MLNLLHEVGQDSDGSHFNALLTLAGFDVNNAYRLENGYWPDSYVELRKAHPWWLFLTSSGPIRMGWRKRVISINWADTKHRGVITKDNVTKDDQMVHAWSYLKAHEYLIDLRIALDAKEVKETVDA